MKSLCLGIDFGTCRTSAAVLIGGDIHSVPFGSGDDKPDMLTAVFVDGDGQFLVGEDAEKGMLRDPSRFFERFKPNLGRSGIISSGGAEFSYTDLVAAVLLRVRLTAQNKLNNEQPIVSACITVPTLYVEGGDAWKVMEDAAKRAGFSDVRLVREPHAAAIYYDSLLRQVDQGSKSDQITLVYDLGGGTFDPALIQRECEGYRILGAVSGEEGVRCGGIYFDEAIREDFVRKCPGVLDELRIDPAIEESTTSRRRKYRDIQDLREMLQQAKIQLSQPGVETYRGNEPTADSEYILTRLEFERMISPLLDETLCCCDALVRRVGLNWKQIDRILMVGGSCHIPLVRKKLEAFAKSQGASPEVCWRRIGTTDKFYNPLLAVGFGASQAGVSREAIPNQRQSDFDSLCKIVSQLCSGSDELKPLRIAAESLIGAWKAPLRVAFVGRINSGKSTLVNAIARKRICGVGNGVVTIVPEWIRFGRLERTIAVWADGTKHIISDSERVQGDLKGLLWVEREISDPNLKDWEWIDTPGLGLPFTKESDSLERLFSGPTSHPHLIVYVLPGAMRKDDLEELSKLASTKPHLFNKNTCMGVLAKADIYASEGQGPIEMGERVADQIRSQRNMFNSITPVVAETAMGAVELDSKDLDTLKRLSLLRRELSDRICLLGERFAGREYPDEPTIPSAADRVRLLEKLGLFGVKQALSALRGGQSEIELRLSLERESGMGRIRSQIFKDSERTKLYADYLFLERQVLDSERTAIGVAVQGVTQIRQRMEAFRARHLDG